MQFKILSMIKLDIKKGQGLEELFLYLRFLGGGDPTNESYTTRLGRQKIDDQLRIPELQAMQHYSPRLYQHPCKNTKKQSLTENIPYKIWPIELKYLTLHPQKKATVPSSIG